MEMSAQNERSPEEALYELYEENVSFIEDFYWKIINSPKSKKVADLLVDHLLDAKDKLEIQVQELSKN